MDEVYSEGGDEVMAGGTDLPNPNAIISRPEKKMCLAMVKLKLAELESAIDKLEDSYKPVAGKDIKKALSGE